MINPLQHLLISRKYRFRGTVEDFDQLLAKTDEFDFSGDYYPKDDEYEFNSHFSIGTVQNQAGNTDGIRIFGKITEVVKEEEILIVELFTRVTGGIVFGVLAGLLLVIIGITQGNETRWLIGLGFIASLMIVGIYRAQQSVLMEAVKNCFRMRRIRE